MDDDQQVISWTSPTRKYHTSGRYITYEPIARQLQARPNEWAQLPDRSSPSAAYQFALGIKRGIPKAFNPKGAYEGANDGVSVWVRYVGGEAEQVDEDMAFGGGPTGDELINRVRPDQHEYRPDPQHAFDL